MMQRNKPLPSKNVLESTYRYDAESGKLFWRIKPCRRDPPEIEAGWFDSKGYKRVSLCKHKYAVHRIIWKLIYNEEPDEIDHINGMRSDNRITNLRAANTKLNQRNRRKINKLLPKGVYLHSRKNRFIAQIKKDGIHYYLGCFEHKDEAHLAYVKKAKELFGDFSNDGVGPCL